MNRKVRDHYMFRLAMSGELISLRAPARAPAPPTSASDELRRMMADGLIRYYRHSDRKRTFRICDPAGFGEIESLGRGLYEHAELMTGKPGARYPGSRLYRIKKRKEATLINDMLDAGFIVDGAMLDEDGQRYFSPSLADPKEIIRNSPKSLPLYLSGPVLKQAAEGQQHSRREMSISSGSIICGSGTISVFLIGTANFRWYAASETQTALDIKRLREDSLGLPRSRDRRLRALLLAEKKDIVRLLLERSGKEDAKMDPTSIFKLCYAVPVEEADKKKGEEDPDAKPRMSLPMKEHALDVAKMLALPDWKKKTNEILKLTPLTGDDGADAVAKDGKPVYNLLCCNLGRIKELERQIQKGRCRVIVHDWQKDSLEKAYGTELDATVLTAAHFRGLLIEAQKK